MATFYQRQWTSPKTGKKGSAWVCAYHYTDNKTKKRKRAYKYGFATKGAAEEWYDLNIAAKVRQGPLIPDSRSGTVAHAAKLWLDHCKAREKAKDPQERLEHSTVEQRRQHIQHHIVPFIGGEKLGELDVDAWLDELKAQGRSLAMRRKVLGNLKRMIGHAQRRKLVSRNPADGVRIEAVDRGSADDGAPRPGETMPSKDELRALMDPDSYMARDADSYGDLRRYRPLIVLLVYTGLRISEARGLRWQDVDLDLGRLAVCQRADKWGRIGGPKSRKGRRTVPLAPAVVEALREWCAHCPKPSEAHKAAPLVFPNVRGGVASYANLVHRVLYPLQKRCGIVRVDGKPKYGFHALRHAAASLFIEQGVSVKWIQERMGHASSRLTMDLYGKLFEDPEADRRAVAGVQAALHG